jgi:hypothetical protein
MSIGGSPESFSQDGKRPEKESFGQAVKDFQESESNIKADAPGAKAVRDIFEKMTEELHDNSSA